MASPSAFAVTANAIWTGGGGSNNWNDTSNWANGQNPDGSGSSFVHFAGTTRLTPLNDYGAYTQFQQILFDSGAGSFTLSGAAIKLYSGGTAKIENNSGNAQTVTLNSDGNSIIFVSNGELDPTAGDLTINNGIYFDAGNTLSVYGSNKLTLNGVLGNGSGGSNAVGLALQSAATVVLNGTNTYSLATTINNGTVSVANLTNGGTAGALGTSSNVQANLVINAGTLRYTGSGGSTDRRFTIGTGGATLDASGTGAIVFSNTDYVFYGAGDTTPHVLRLAGTNTAGNTLAARVDDLSTYATSLVKNGAGTWLLTSPNGYTGGTTLNAGTLQIGNDSALGGGALTVAGAATVQANAAARSIANAVTAGGNLTVSGANALAVGGAFTVTGGDRTLDNATANGLTLGTVYLSESNSVSRRLTIGSSTTASPGTTTISGPIANNAGGNTLACGLTVGGGGTVIFAGNNSYTGTTIVQHAGTVLQVGNNTGSGTLGAGNVTLSAGTLRFKRSDSLTVNNVISGAGVIEQAGGGKTILNASNGYTGGTTVTAGTLLAGVSGATGTGAITVGDGTNAGSGTLAGAVSLSNGANLLTVAKGGTITAGTGPATADSAATLITGAQEWDGGGRFLVKFKASNVTGSVSGNGANWDRLLMSTLSLGAGTNSGNPFVIRIANASGSTGLTLNANQQYGLAHFTTAISSTLLASLSLSFDPTVTITGGNSGSLSLVNGGTDLVLSTAPEPGTMLLSGLGAGVLAGRRRRRG